MDDGSDKIKAIQSILGVDSDGIWGPKTQAALDALKQPVVSSTSEVWHTVKATSFADPGDVERFKECKSAGGYWAGGSWRAGNSDEHCFNVGDNGIGCWEDDLTVNVAYCALPPDDMIERWGSVDAAKHQRVNVNIGNATIECILGDRMPWKKDITNGAGIDLNYHAVISLGQQPPLFIGAAWRWA